MFGFKKSKLGKRSSPQTTGRTKPVYSYYSNQANRNSFKLKVKTKRPNDSKQSVVHKLPAILLLLAVVTSLAYGLQLNSNPIIIQNSNDSKLFLHDKNTYQESVHKLFSSSVLNSNKITVDTNSIAQKLIDAYPELQRVEINIPIFSHRPSVFLYPSSPTLKIISGNSLYIVNQNGKVISVNPDELYNYLPTITDESNMEVEIGKDILPKDYINFISEISKQFRAKNIIIESITLPTSAEELNVKIKGQSYIIKFNLQGEARQQAGTFLATKRYLEKKNIKPSQYIDVRVEEKAYYK